MSASLEHLPLDIWCRIIESGHFSIRQVVELLKLNRQLNRVLKHNAIWYNLLYTNYLQILLQYDTGKAKHLVQHRNDKNLNFYNICLSIYKKDLKFTHYLNNETDFNKFVVAFTQDDDYLPIIYNHYFNINNIPYNLKNEMCLSLSQRAFCLSLLNMYSYRLGLTYYKQIWKSPPGDSSPSMFEEFWFKVSLLDRYCHHFIFARQKLLTTIFKTLHKEITVKLFYNQSEGIAMCPDKDKDILTFANRQVLIEVIKRIFTLTFSCLSFENLYIAENSRVLENFTEFDFLKDFSILRIYAGKAKGYPYLIMSLLAKILHEVLVSKYRIRFADSLHDHDILIKLTSLHIIIEDYFFLIRWNGVHRFKVETLQDIIATFGRYGMSRLLIPLDLNDVNSACLLNDSNSLFPYIHEINPNNYFNCRIKDLDKLVNLFFCFMTPQSYKFNRIILRLLKDGNILTYDQQKHCIELAVLALYKATNFIHFKTIYNLLDEPIKSVFLNHIISQNGQFATINYESRDQGPDLRIIRSSLTATKEIPVNESTLHPFQPGHIVKHNKFETYSIILGKLNEDDETPFYKVISTNYTIDCFKETSLLLITLLTPNVELIIHYLIKMIGEDIIGLLHYDYLVVESSVPRFKSRQLL